MTVVELTDDVGEERGSEGVREGGGAGEGKVLSVDVKVKSLEPDPLLKPNETREIE